MTNTEPVTADEVVSPSTLRKLRKEHKHSTSISVAVDDSQSDEGLDVERLPSIQYNKLLLKVETQIQGVIKQAIFLQKRQFLIERIVISESIIFLVVNSMSSLIGASDVKPTIRIAFMYFFFAAGVIFSCLGLVVKWLKSKQDKDIDSYRNILKDLVELYDQDAWYAIERERMDLPSSVLAGGFFRGINKKSSHGDSGE